VLAPWKPYSKKKINMAKRTAPPKSIIIEYFLDGVLRDPKSDSNVLKLSIDGRNIPHDVFSKWFSNDGFLGIEDWELFEATVFGIQKVRTSRGTYKLRDSPEIRSDDLGERGGYYRIVKVNLELSSQR
jgi:hypothetical protein